MRFRAAKDFWCEETRSQYVAGQTYTARDQELIERVGKWIAEGKVRVMDKPEAKISGRGTSGSHARNSGS